MEAERRKSFLSLLILKVDRDAIFYGFWVRRSLSVCFGHQLGEKGIFGVLLCFETGILNY